MKIKGFRGIRCQYGLNQRESFPVYFASVLFLGKMGRGYARLPFEDNRGCPWTKHIQRHTLLSCEGNLKKKKKANRVSSNDLVERK